MCLSSLWFVSLPNRPGGVETSLFLQREPWDVFPWLYLTALILFGVVWGLFAEKSRLRHDIFAWPAWMVLEQFVYALVFGHSDFSMGPLALVMFAVTGIPAAIGLCIGRSLRSKEKT